MSDTFFSGSITALITPMNRDGSLDFASFEKLVDWQIREGTAALCAVGTTGESPTLSHAEHHAVVERTIKVSAGRVPVIAGAGSNSTSEAIDLAQYAEKAGANAVLVVAPYYNKPTQEGLYRHYMAIADAISIPVILYNIPGRSIVDISVETMARLARHPNIIGVKDATANLLRPLQVRRAVEKRFNQLSGEDGTAVAFLAAGGDGCISVTANVAPALCANVQKAWQQGRTQDAIAIQDKLLPLHDTLFCESNPAPAKYAASLLGLAGETCRLPLAPLTEPSREKIRAALVDVGLLN
ncbi:4-hydroxy-tetrahydrodipicolinate synthase [Acetobacter pasteurianus]|uniref:4-hydroxy-tetrahydrodipicolinate synthase n=5 Tax=Acetobacter pasteurianus TaxID=438 RepID=A0A401WSS3_ACEPA|nr:4-hydroxy-tetrahydrodipicolinate synthase [Acetobacter pasteurianus]ASC04321.1 4-hydroxy-tetrahydrodipicolinate synthase [Acetobacter pasteurianus subsp. pasteurianus]OAZ73053.1 4-hydroxy-tetrahydrodipicolinate synthase [Acetobacter pasteurianus]QHM90477.1 4-hydroxy-tetrahydrodipicolinate synthase [Acetobacter pasteurianus]BAH99333.1 dihydrodipicolinate synthase [Acetobacter pasteurianus IFO 3283-01]BAI02386.1 dihydrodipicolinate synthase [Acetobacter pasteurianus IFO 3283-03]